MNKQYEILREKLGKTKVKLAQSMLRWTTFKIGGPADLFYEAKTTAQVIKTVRLCRELKVPYFVLGGGSNLLVSDRGIRGMVIKIQNSKFKIQNSKIIAGAGVPLKEVVEMAAKNSLSGLEFAVGIPGTVGGAVVGNVGAWQQSLGQKISRVKILTKDGQIKWIAAQDCQFTYRESRFKRSGEIVLEAQLKLEPGNYQEIKRTMGKYLEKRKGQPRQPSAGSIFINPKPKVAGALIEQCGLKGHQIGKARISSQHANFIVNLGGARCEDVLKLISLAKQKVKEKFGVNLKEEIKIVGEF